MQLVLAEFEAFRYDTTFSRLNSSLKKVSKIAMSIFYTELEYGDRLIMPKASTPFIFVSSSSKPKLWSFESRF